MVETNQTNMARDRISELLRILGDPAQLTVHNAAKMERVYYGTLGTLTDIYGAESLQVAGIQRSREAFEDGIGTRGSRAVSGMGHALRGVLQNTINELDSGNINPANSTAISLQKEGAFFAGQHFDSLLLVTRILEEAEELVRIVDGYIDNSVLSLLTSVKKGVTVQILTKEVSDSVRTLSDAYNSDREGLEIRTSDAFHDRFIIIDEQHYYHFGASIKDAGRTRGFMFSRIEEPEVIQIIRDQWESNWEAASADSQ